MTLLDALLVVREAALSGVPVSGEKGGRAMKVVNKKIASLSRKKAWRDSLGQVPDHARHPEHPLNQQ